MAMKHYFRLRPGDTVGVFGILNEYLVVEKYGNVGRYHPVTSWSNYTGMVIPVKKTTDIDKCNFIGKQYNFSIKMTMSQLISSTGNKYKGKIPQPKQVQRMIKSFLSTIYGGSSYEKLPIQYLDFGNDNELVLRTHMPGTFTAKVKQYYTKKSGIIQSAGEVSKNYSLSNLSAPNDKDDFKNGKEWNAVSTVVIDLYTTSKTLATKGNYDIGADYSGKNTGSSYCFYCNDYNATQRLSYLTSIPYCTITGHKSHSSKTHNATPVKQGSGLSNNYNSNTSYKPTKGKPLPSTGDYGKVGRLELGTVGEYVDGVARTPMIMIELKGSENAEKGYNISIPAKSLVSLEHERNMKDSYNTFVLQVFDKDALEIEAKLLLGFRYITFYYTDFVATSKKFKGEILDYKTTIAGKGIMLTINGYSSNTYAYVGKDSIPWSIICEVNGIEFYYWTNKAGEYHGEVRRTVENGVEHYCSTEGVLESPRRTPLVSQIGPYELKKVSKEDPTKTEWVTFDAYYHSASSDVRDKYRPYPQRFSLSSQAYNINASQILIDYDFDLTERRPSDIVALICIINNWSYDIVETKPTSNIPDQVSMSYIEYIKEKLIPISVTEGSRSGTQYYFWFDDNGVANYKPYNPTVTKKLVFNSKEQKDTYPLIGFTAATNGSILMVTDATQTIEAINAFTGDALSLSSLKETPNDEAYLSTVVESSEWYQTNRAILNKPENKNRLISYANTSSIPSEDELKKELLYRYGTVSRYSFEAELDVYGCADISPGDYVDIQIYLGDAVRSSADVSTESDYYKEQLAAIDQRDNTNILTYVPDVPENRKYIGNLTMHHSSGKYIVQKIIDSVQAGKYVSKLKVFKINESNLLSTISYDESTDTSKKETEDISDKVNKPDDNHSSGTGRHR